MTRKPGYIEPTQDTASAGNTSATPTTPSEDAPRHPGYAPEEARDTLQPQTDTLATDPATSRLPEMETQLGQGSASIGKSIVAVIAAVILLILTNELVALWQSHWLLGLFGSGVITAVLLGVLNTWRQERRSAKEIKRLKGEQEAIQQSLKKHDLTALKAALTPWLERQGKAAPELIQRFKDAAIERTTTEEYWQLYQLMVLRTLDLQADKIIHHYTLTTGTAVMVIPHAGLDTLVVLWRSRAMSREIAAVYGLETTSLSILQLFRQALVTVMVVAGIETLAQEKLLSEGSDELMNRILGGVSQSLITARRTYKLGRLIQLACRPNA